MNKKLIYLTLGIFFSVTGLCYSQVASLKILIKGFQHTSGNVFVGLYNKPSGFASEDTYMNFSGLILSKDVWIVFDSIPKGTYAIAIIHDENNNQKLDQGEFGIPVEGYGFSNDARGILGPPDFRTAMFSFSGTSDKTIIINLIYPKKKL